MGKFEHRKWVSPICTWSNKKFLIPPTQVWRGDGMTMTRRWIDVVAGGFVLNAMIVGCVNSPAVQHQSDSYVDKSVEIVLAPPAVEYRDVHTNARQDVAASDREQAEAALASITLEELRAAGFQARAMNQDDMARFKVGSGVGAFCDLAVSVHLFCLKSRFYVGPGWFWEPFSGGIKSGGSRIVVEARVVSGMDGKTLWQQMAQLREAQDVGRDMLKETIHLMLQTLKAR